MPLCTNIFCLHLEFWGITLSYSKTKVVTGAAKQILPFCILIDRYFGSRAIFFYVKLVANEFCFDFVTCTLHRLQNYGHPFKDGT